MRAIECRADIERGVAALLAADHRLRAVVEAAGEVPLRLSTPDFAGLARIVISQQVSTASAAAIHGRLLALVDPLEAGALAACEDSVFRQAGLSRPKQRTLVGAAEAVLDGRLDLPALARMPADDAMAALTGVKGIGPWTAEIYLLFCGGHPDIFPTGDLALQEAVRAALALEGRPGDRELRRIAAAWSPWRGVAARLFWAYYRAIKGGGDALPV
ncbi:MAG: DNA-3-methyladenine glycosylase 2 family protein [Pseudomonadota bacterium]|nr:DNA-3-methyladenine glycosylase 2 family protein [Pseudomonadota bacterium]